MIGFLIKKTFFDAWDNLFALLAVNLIYGVICAVPVVVFFLLRESVTLIMMLVLILSALALLSFHSLGASALSGKWSCYTKGGIKSYFNAIRNHFRHALVYFIIYSFIVLSFLFILPSYFSTGTPGGTIIGLVLLWVSVLLLLSSQFYFPLCILMEKDGPFKTLKKSFIVLGDNMLYAVFLALRSIIDTVLTLATLSLVPGLGGINLSRTDTMKLIMLRYDYMDSNNIKDKKQISWSEILYNDRNAIGHRSLKDMFFPWR